MKRQFLLTVSVGCLLLGGCASDGTSFGSSSSVERVEYGRVTNLQYYSPQHSGPINLGTVIGGIAGGVIGHQFGGGTGNTIFTIAGAIGGAVAGHEIQRSTEKERIDITVRLDSGGQITVNQVAQDVEVRVGDRVRVVNDKVYRN